MSTGLISSLEFNLEKSLDLTEEETSIDFLSVEDFLFSKG